MAAHDNFNVAILATDGFEESELTEPAKALGQAGGKVDVISLHEGRIQAFKHFDKTVMVPVDLTIDQARPEQYNALMLPGGALNADVMRADPRVQQFIRAMAQANKPMAVICHAPWELISARCGARAHAHRLLHHPGRRPQCRRKLGEPGGGGRRQSGDEPAAK